MNKKYEEIIVMGNCLIMYSVATALNMITFNKPCINMHYILTICIWQTQSQNKSVSTSRQQHTCTTRTKSPFINRAAEGGRGSRIAFGFFFLVLSATISKPPRMMSSSANYRPFLSSFRHIPPQESFVKLAN